jgi:hypothetical protein|nr:hypothetical protein [Neorhizobium tomejilense]
MAFTYQELVDHADLNTDGVSGFEAQIALGKLKLHAVWPEHLTGKRVEDFCRGAEIARAWLNMRKGVATARRSMRLQEKKEIGIMRVYSPSNAAERKAEQIETLKQVMKTYRLVGDRLAAEQVEPDAG